MILVYAQRAGTPVKEFRYASHDDCCRGTREKVQTACVLLELSARLQVPVYEDRRKQVHPASFAILLRRGYMLVSYGFFQQIAAFPTSPSPF